MKVITEGYYRKLLQKCVLLNNVDIYVFIHNIFFSFLGKARIRVQISAAHTDKDIDRAIDAFIDIGRKLKVIN